MWITFDLVGIDRELSRRVRARLHATHGLADAQVALCASHTHTGPVVGQNLAAMYMPDERHVRASCRVCRHTRR